MADTARTAVLVLVGLSRAWGSPMVGDGECERCFP
jgi:hypothetical protein